MFKRLCAVLIAVLMAASLFGFSPKSLGITENDVEVFITDFEELDSILDEALDIEFDDDLETMSVPSIMSLIPSDLNKKATKKLNDLGISGTNALEKVFVITYGVAYNYMKTMVDFMKLFAEEDDSTFTEMDEMLSIYEDSFSEEDYKVIEQYMDELYDLMGWASDGGYSDDDWSDYDWDDYDYDDYDWDDYDWDDDDDYGYWWDDDDYDYDYDWGDYDWGDYDWDDDYDYFTEEEELESETGVKFLKELMPSLSSKSGSADFLYKTIKPGTYTKITETDENALMFQKEWAGSKYPTLTVSEFCISMSYRDPNDPDADWYDEVYKYYDIDSTTELYKATIRGTVYYERVIKTKQYGTIRIWVDGTNLGEGEDVYYSDDVYAVLSIGDYIIEGTAFVPAG